MPFLLIIVGVISPLHAQQSIKNSKQDPNNNKPEKGKLYFTGTPFVSSNPSYGLIFGVSGAFNMYLGEPADTRISSALASIMITSKKQLLITYKSSLLLPKDKWVLLGDWRYFVTSQPTFGLGTGPQSSKLASNGFEYSPGFFSKPISDEQLLTFKYIRIHETALTKVKKDVYLGIGYHLDYHFDINDNLLNTDTLPPVLTSHYTYSKKYGFDPGKYSLSGISLNFLYDSRDNQVNPYAGQYILARYRINPKFLGSTVSSSSLWLEYRNFVKLTKKPQPSHMLALWLYGDFEVSGHIPYMDLPALGWDQFGRSGRGYTQGRFRGQQLIYGELEYRVHLFGIKNNKDLVGAVVFVNGTSATNKDAGIKMFKYVEPGYGVGLRIMVNKKTRSDVTIDYAIGRYGSKGLYFNINETF